MMSRKYTGRLSLGGALVSVPRLWYDHDYRFNHLSEEFIGAVSAKAFCTELWHDNSYDLDGLQGIPGLTVSNASWSYYSYSIWLSSMKFQLCYNILK